MTVEVVRFTELERGCDALVVMHNDSDIDSDNDGDLHVAFRIDLEDAGSVDLRFDFVAAKELAEALSRLAGG